MIAGRRLEDAQQQTKLLLEQRPSDPVVHSLASGLLAAQGDTQGAIVEIQKTIALTPGNWAPHLSLALLQMKSGDFEQAELNLKKVIELDARSVPARLQLGKFYSSRKRLDEAERKFREAIDLDPQSMEPREALAKLLLAEGHKNSAEETLVRAKHDLPTNPASVLALSKFYFMTGDLGKAVAEYDGLHRTHQLDTQIKKKYIQLLILANRFNDAQTLNDELLRSSPHDSDGLLYRSQMQISEGNVSDAIQTLQSVIKDLPDSSDAHYTLGIAFEKQGDLDRAWGEWQTALRINPDMLEAQRSVANAAIEKSDMRALQSAATQIVRLQSHAADGYALLALSSMNLNQFDRANDYIHKAIEVGPQSAFGYVQQGNLRLIQKRYGESVAAYQETLSRNPHSTDALRGLVNALVAERQFDRAVTAVNAQIVKSPSNSVFYNLLGDLLLHQQRDFAGAEKALERSTALDRSNSNAWMELCEVRATKRGIARAIETDQEAIKENPRRASLQVLLGNLYESNSDWKNAEAAYQMALTVDSNNPIAATNLARAMLHTGGNLDVALSLVQSARVALPDSPFVFDTMGWIYYSRGSYSLALNCLNQALGLQTAKNILESPDIHYHLGMIYEKMKQPVLARKHLEQVLKINPAYPDMDEIRQKLDGLSSYKGVGSNIDVAGDYAQLQVTVTS